MQLKIKKEFKELIPDLSAEEFKQLEDNCINDGIRDKLIIWEDYIIDGHNRFEIAGKHNLKFQTEEIAFDNEDEAKIFIINLQLGRRNLVEFVKIELMQKRKEILLKVGKEKQREAGKLYGENHKQEVLSIIDKTSHNTREKLSKELKISSGKLAQAEIVIKKATPEVKQKLRAGEISINNAYQDIKKNEKREEVYKKEISYKENIKEVTEFDVDIFTTDKKFNIVYADPCWQYWEGGEKNQSLHYPTMTIQEIKDLPIEKISDENCILFIWVTYPILIEALEVIKCWGFKYSTCGFVWVKKNKVADSYFFGNGAWTRANTELCLIATKGSITRIDASISQIIDEKIMGHSEKPKCIRDLILRLVGNLPRIELFSRNNNEDGWFNWGNNI